MRGQHNWQQPQAISDILSEQNISATDWAHIQRTGMAQAEHFRNIARMSLAGRPFYQSLSCSITRPPSGVLPQRKIILAPSVLSERLAIPHLGKFPVGPLVLPPPYLRATFPIRPLPLRHPLRYFSVYTRATFSPTSKHPPPIPQTSFSPLSQSDVRQSIGPLLLRPSHLGPQERPTPPPSTSSLRQPGGSFPATLVAPPLGQCGQEPCPQYGPLRWSVRLAVGRLLVGRPPGHPGYPWAVWPAYPWWPANFCQRLRPGQRQLSVGTAICHHGFRPSATTGMSTTGMLSPDTFAQALGGSRMPARVWLLSPDTFAQDLYDTRGGSPQRDGRPDRELSLLLLVPPRVCWQLAAGCWLLAVAGCWLLAAGC